VWSIIDFGDRAGGFGVVGCRFLLQGLKDFPVPAAAARLCSIQLYLKGEKSKSTYRSEISSKPLAQALHG
jgi:hypothetical protein